MPISMYFPSGLALRPMPEPIKHCDPTLPSESLDTEFKRDYPPDVFGHEVDDTARVWKVYRTHASAHDDTLLDGWNATLDILLIFAGLFSAVVTAFLIESYQTLAFDNDAYVANALYAIVAANEAASALVHLPRPPPFAASPPAAARSINGLWFISLFLALAVSLVSILIKQWLREYKVRNNAPIKSPRHWSHRRTFLFQALTNWPVAGLISVLPVLLHIALFLFLAGAVFFLWDLDRAIGISIGILGLLLGAFYAASIVIALWRPESPTSMPAVNVIRFAFMVLRIAVLQSRIAVAQWALSRAKELKQEDELPLREPQHTFHSSSVGRYLARTVPGFIRSRLPRRHTLHDAASVVTTTTPDTTTRSASVLSTQLRRIVCISLEHVGRIVFSSLVGDRSIEEVRADHIGRLEQRVADYTLIKSYLESNSHGLEMSALKWLITVVSDGDAVAVGLQALGALPFTSSDAAIREVFSVEAVVTHSLGDPGQTEMARVARTMLNIGAVPQDNPHLFNMLETTYPDFVLLTRLIDGSGFSDPAGLGFSDTDESWKLSPSLTSTLMVVLRCCSDKAQPADLLSLLRYCRLYDPSMDWRCVARLLRARNSDIDGELNAVDGERRDIVAGARTLQYVLEEISIRDGGDVGIHISRQSTHLCQAAILLLEFLIQCLVTRDTGTCSNSQTWGQEVNAPRSSCVRFINNSDTRWSSTNMSALPSSIRTSAGNFDAIGDSSDLLNFLSSPWFLTVDHKMHILEYALPLLTSRLAQAIKYQDWTRARTLVPSVVAIVEKFTMFDRYDPRVSMLLDRLGQLFTWDPSTPSESVEILALALLPWQNPGRTSVLQAVWAHPGSVRDFTAAICDQLNRMHEQTHYQYRYKMGIAMQWQNIDLKKDMFISRLTADIRFVDLLRLETTRPRDRNSLPVAGGLPFGPFSPPKSDSYSPIQRISGSYRRVSATSWTHDLEVAMSDPDPDLRDLATSLHRLQDPSAGAQWSWWKSGGPSSLRAHAVQDIGDPVL